MYFKQPSSFNVSVNFNILTTDIEKAIEIAKSLIKDNYECKDEEGSTSMGGVDYRVIKAEFNNKGE